MIKRSAKLLSLMFLLLPAAVIIGSCSRFHTTPIGSLLEDPRGYEGKVVTIEGQVTDNKSLILVKYFKIKDGTGEIVVLTDRLLPNIGRTERVRGKVDQTFLIGNSGLTVLIEEPEEN